jgi:hypothetical protein
METAVTNAGWTDNMCIHCKCRLTRFYPLNWVTLDVLIAYFASCVEMPCVNVCVGQAGNQVGSSALRYTGQPIPLGPGEESGYAAGGSVHMPSGKRSGKRPAGCVFVDSEPKVVRNFFDNTSNAYLPFADESNVMYDQSGRGNNWAWGYTGIAAHRGYASSLPVAARDTGGGITRPKRVEPLWSRAMVAVRKQVCMTAVYLLDNVCQLLHWSLICRRKRVMREEDLMDYWYITALEVVQGQVLALK